MNQAEIVKRFSYHPPREPGVANLIGSVRLSVRSLAEFLNDALPESREKSLAFTALEEALMWANAAIARNQA
jgi:hypothetical protein